MLKQTDAAQLLESAYREQLAANPHEAVELGLHRFDGRLPDVSPRALQTEIARLQRRRAELGALAETALTQTQLIERAVMLSTINRELFVLSELKAPWKNPMYYTSPLSLVSYVARPYASAAERARAIIALTRATPAYLAQARANLAERMPRSWLSVALIQTKGLQAFASDVPRALGDLPSALADQLRQALAGWREQLKEHAAFLERRQQLATDDFAIGKAVFLRMLAETQGVKVSLERLKDVAKRDLARNLEALTVACRQIDPKKSVAELIAVVSAERPSSAEQAYAIATAQGARLRKLLVARNVVSIPSDDVVEVRATPAFMRWNSAFLDSAGPFETKALPSFYYISPPDPSWPIAQQKQYLPATVDLLFVTAHELWPGHFLDHLHGKQQHSAILKSFGGYARGEGWAHYAEELMLQHGLDGDPKVRIGQLLNALLRNVRFVAAIGLHTEGMTVEQAAELFRTKAFTDEASAMQQARRGTFDPMYLSYTLGKLMIVKLRDDYRKKLGAAYSERRFHDQFLGCCGSAPISVTRRVLLGDDSPAL
ncbi:MAG: DUF885 domain-containing protein [Deltaproteobacteria bacterium]|nr:DUF885 domain-containing protein [Deltaproteobacteria bacterium]